MLKGYKPQTLILLPFFFIILFSIFIRVQGLGYSNFQGDEVGTIDFIYKDKVDVYDYLLQQKKGPIQFLVNITNVRLFGYNNEYQIRFPYLVFGIAALYTVYILGMKTIGKLGAFIAVVFMAVNGLFIAFSRITQYQSLMYMTIPVGVVIFIKAFEKRKKWMFAVSGFIMSFAFLAHYDTLSVVPFFVAAFIGYYYRKKNISIKNTGINLKVLISYCLIFSTTFIIPAIFYYIPFTQGDHFDDQTSGYLERRLFGGGLMPRTGLTLKLIDMYAPRYYWYALFLLGVVGLLFLSRKIGFSFTIRRINFKEKLTQGIFLFLVAFFTASNFFSLYPIKPRTSSVMVIFSAVAICMFLIFSKKVDWKKASLASWFLGAYSFYFFIMKDPRTHVYISMIPLFILSGYGIFRIYLSFRYIALRYVLISSVLTLLILTSIFNWVIFVDRNPEYPWWDKDYLPGVNAYHIEKTRHNKIDGVFGFNAYRGWSEIKTLFDKGCLIGTFNSNEKDSITYFYIRERQRKGSQEGIGSNLADNLFIIEGPHSWIYDDHEKYLNEYYLLDTIKSGDYVVNYILGRKKVYPEGKYYCE